MSASSSPSTLRSHGTPMPGGWPMQLSPFAILAVTAGYLWLRWNDIPSRFPVHWGMGGQANGWSLRTPMGVYGPLLFGAGLIAIFAASSYAALHFGRPAPDPASGSLAHDFAREMGVFLLSVEFFLAVIFSFVGLLPLMGDRDPGIVPLLVATLAMLAALIFAIARLAKHHAEHARRAPDEFWRWGVFYVNRDDTALFVPKRFGIGYTLNFGHTAAWIIMALALLVPIAFALSVAHLSNPR